MIFYCPSYKRAGMVKTRKLFPDAVLVVNENERDEYLEKEGGEILAHPDNIRGNMSKVRNFILDKAEDEEIIMMDDDILDFHYVEFSREKNSYQNYILEISSLLELIENGFEMARELKTPLWGINVQTDPRFYREYSPVSLKSVILGTFSAHRLIDRSLRYDVRLGLKEDYDFFLQVMYKHRKVLRFNKYSYRCRHIDLEGGCSSYRMLDEEKKQAELLQDKWGKKIVKYDVRRSLNPILKITIPGC